MGNNRRADAALCGDGRTVLTQLHSGLVSAGWKGYSKNAPWFKILREKVAKSTAGLQRLMADEKSPMSYYRAFRDVHGLAPRDAIIVTEGANTMDIGRGLFVCGSCFCWHVCAALVVWVVGVECTMADLSLDLTAASAACIEGILSNDLPRRRIDAGSYGTMGVGLGQAIAAQVSDKQVLFDVAALQTIFGCLLTGGAILNTCCCCCCGRLCAQIQK